MTAREIAEKYVYGKHDALTDNQEIEDMIKDIEDFAKNNSWVVCDGKNTPLTDFIKDL